MKQLQFKLKLIQVEELDPNYQKSKHGLMSKEGKKPDMSKWHSFLEDVKENGFYDPLTVQEKNEHGKYPILDGRNRYEAAKVLKIKDVWCIVVAGKLQSQKELEIIDKMQFLRRDNTEQSLKEVLFEKFGDLIKAHKGRSSVGVNLSNMISVKTGIPEGTVKRLITEIKDSLTERDMRDGKVLIPQTKLQEGVSLYKQWKNLEARAKQYRSDSAALATQIRKIAPIAYFAKLDKENQKPVKGK